MKALQQRAVVLSSGSGKSGTDSGSNSSGGTQQPGGRTAVAARGAASLEGVGRTVRVLAA